MFKVTSVKKSIIFVVAMLLCVAVVFAACSPKAFQPVEKPAKGDVDSNGGVAVRYGDWLYYVNGYTSNVSAENSYVDSVKDAPRIGSVVRIKLADIEELFAIDADDDLKSSEKTNNIAAYVRAHAETVVPQIYYSGNSTTTQITGIYIFGDRIYVTTPNDELTAGGNPRTSELVLMSFGLDGSDPVRHFVFTSNSAQIWLVEKDNKVVATYLMDNVFHLLDVESGVDTVVTNKAATDSDDDDNNTVSSVKWDAAGKCLFFLDYEGSICKLNVGEATYEVIKQNDVEHNHGDHVHSTITYTISSVNNGQVYYTVADSENTQQNNVVLYWATSAQNVDNVALSTNAVSTFYGWKDGKVVISKTEAGSYYGLYVVWEENGIQKETVLSPAYNDSAVTVNRIEGDTLYYTANSVSYKLDLNKGVEQQEGVAYAKSLASATGWAAPDFLTVGDINYVITANSSGISIVKFDVEKKTNSTSISLTLTAEPDED